MKIIFFLLILFIVLQVMSYSLPVRCKTVKDNYTIYLIKQRWHTGIILKVKDIDTTEWPEIMDFSNSEFVDVGWGDSAFYQNPNFNIVQAVSALFTPSPSTLRVFGFDTAYENIFHYYDIVVKIQLNDIRLKKLCKYIHDAYSTDSSGKLIVYKSEYNGRIKFYKSIGKYNIFNTCNTWIAKGLNKIGFTEISPHIILAEELFRRARLIGKIIK